METRCIGSKRDMLIHVLEEEMKARAKPCQSPDFSCYIGEAALYRNGIISVPDDREYVLITLSKLGLCDYPYEIDAPEAGSIAFPSVFIPECRIKHELRMPAFRLRKPGFFHVPVDSVNALAKFLHQIILVQKFNDLRIAVAIRHVYGLRLHRSLPACAVSQSQEPGTAAQQIQHPSLECMGQMM